MRVLLTGAKGFIGQHMVQSFGEDVEVFSLVRKARSLSSNLQRQDGRVNLVEFEADLSRGLNASQLPERIDTLILLAQSNQYREFPQGAPDMFAVNTRAVAELLNYAVTARASSVLLASTGAVYEPFVEPMREDKRLAPKSYYAATKLAAEQLLNAYQDHFNGCALRLFFPYGAGQEARLVPDLIARIRERRAIHLNGASGGNTLNPTYVDDVVSVFKQALVGHWSGVINVANPESVSIRCLSQALAEQIGIEPIFEQRVESPVVHMVPELHELAARFDFSKFHGLAEGLRRTVERQ